MKTRPFIKASHFPDKQERSQPHISIHVQGHQRGNIFVPGTLAVELLWKEWICSNRQTPHMWLTSCILNTCLFIWFLTSFVLKLSLCLELSKTFTETVRNPELNFWQGQLIPCSILLKRFWMLKVLILLLYLTVRNKLALTWSKYAFGWRNLP